MTSVMWQGNFYSFITWDCSRSPAHGTQLQLSPFWDGILAPLSQWQILGWLHQGCNAQLEEVKLRKGSSITSPSQHSQEPVSHKSPNHMDWSKSCSVQMFWNSVSRNTPQLAPNPNTLKHQKAHSFLLSSGISEWCRIHLYKWDLSDGGFPDYVANWSK